MSSPIEAAINAVVRPITDAAPGDDGMPYATHSGVLELVPGLRMNVYRLSTGQAVVDQEGMAAFLQWLGMDVDAADKQEGA